MPNEYFTSALEVSYEQLEVIDGIKFTPREIDIMACILSGRGRKSSASLLLISEKTVETHTRNIMRKLECSSQESIRNRLEKSDQFITVKNHYLSLLVEASFSQHLHTISALMKSVTPTCFLICEDEHDLFSPLVVQLEKHLKLTGTTPLLKVAKNNTSDFNWIKKEEVKDAPSVIYFLSDLSLSQLDGKNLPLSSVKTMEDLAKKGKIIIIGVQSQEDFLIGETKVPYFTLTKEKNYYFLFFKILKILFPGVTLSKIIEEFKEEYTARLGDIGKGFDKEEPLANSSIQELSLHLNHPSTRDEQGFMGLKNNLSSQNYKNYFWGKDKVLHGLRRLREKWLLSVGAFCLIVCSILIIILYGNDADNLSKNRKIQSLSTVRSDLTLPTESVFLNRSDLINKINDRLKGQEGIKTIALVGTGGAGKTTLARQYARQQKADFIWEFNAETPESLKDSFENLAHSLSKTEEDKKTLKEILELKNTAKKEEEILFFVKDRLRAHDKWFLLFDNMEKFSDIQKYLPKDDETWGQGKIILTTRDGNIQNNKHINDIILVGVLDENQKLDLFNKIMNSGNPSPHFLSQEEQTKAFLKEIPSFPLDVSLAAYYIKATKIPYSTYMEDLNQYDKDFVIVQESLLKESGEYTKTRYSIIALSLEHLLNAHQDFGDLMLLMCLVDSQEIPRDLLSSYKGENIVGNFIYNLEKYSLATANPSQSPLASPTLSIHRSMQGIILNYLTNTLKPAKRDTAPREISQTIASSINHAIEKENIQKMRLLARHGGVFLRHAHLLNEDSKGPLGTELGRTYFYLGDYQLQPAKAGGLS